MEEISKVALVSILTAQTGRQVVMRDNSYVYLEDKTEVAQADIDTAAAEQEKLYKLELYKAWKKERQLKVDTIKVTTTAGNEFDGDETSQTRLARAISVMSDTDTTTWVLANNSTIEATKAELIEALKLAGEEQTRLWGEGRPA